MKEEPIPTCLPAKELRSLSDKIFRRRWVVPLLPEQELAVLLKTALTIVANGCVFDYIKFYIHKLSIISISIIIEHNIRL